MARLKRKEPQRQTKNSRKCSKQPTSMPGLGTLNADIIINIIDQAHRVGLYDISHLISQLNRHLYGIVYSYHRSFSALSLDVDGSAAKVIGKFAFNQLRGKRDSIDRLSLNVKASAVLDTLYSTGMFDLIKQRIGDCTGILQHLHLNIHDGKSQKLCIPAKHVSMVASPTYDSYPLLQGFSNATWNKSIKSLTLTNVDLSPGAISRLSEWPECQDICLEYNGIVAPRSSSSPFFRRNSGGISTTILTIADGCSSLHSLSIVNSTYANFFETDKTKYGYLASMYSLKELHIVRVNTFTLRIYTPNLEKLKLECCTDLDAQIRKLSPSITYLSIAYGSFKKMPRFIRSDLAKLDKLRSLDVSYTQDEFIQFFFKDKKYIRALSSLVHLNVSGTVVNGEHLYDCVAKLKLDQLVGIDCPFIDKSDQYALSKKIKIVWLDKVKKGFQYDDDIVFDRVHTAAIRDMGRRSNVASDSESEAESYVLDAEEADSKPSIGSDGEAQVEVEEDEYESGLESEADVKPIIAQEPARVRGSNSRYDWRRREPPPPPITRSSTTR
ncbi:hypothetical protein E3P84_02746 [Wallemia ichthyophaga]|nr:hypothetical protein E3P84_02746 [Wallemia ichthyophaga]TIB40740.1 hypothetical protein E3P83_02683 [Wallemia ichthyophaga]